MLNFDRKLNPYRFRVTFKMLINFDIVDRIELMTSPTEDQSKLLASLAKIEIFGKSDFASAVQVAQLSLKYRRNMNGGKRIIVFVGSPLQETIAEIERIAKSLKKNAIAVDVISLGEFEENQQKLTTFVNTTNADENSHLINVPPGVLPSDAMMSSPILMMQHRFGGGMSSVTGFNNVDSNFDEFGGVDPSLDPDVAMAIRASLEEAREREEARAITLDGITSSPDGQQTSQHTHQRIDNDTVTIPDVEDEDTLLQRALEMSLRASTSTGACDENPTNGPQTSHSNLKVDLSSNDDNNALIQALAISTVDNAADDEHIQHRNNYPHQHHDGHFLNEAETDNSASGHIDRRDHDYLDPIFINELLGSVNVDRNDPMVQAALAQMGVDRGDKKNESEKDGSVNKKRKGDDDEKE